MLYSIFWSLPAGFSLLSWGFGRVPLPLIWPPHCCCCSVAKLWPILYDLIDYNTSRILCPSLSPGVCSILCPLSRWCHLTISSSVFPFSFHPQSSPASGSLPMSQLFISGGQSLIASASASVLPINIQSWFLLGLTGLISLTSLLPNRECSPLLLETFLTEPYSDSVKITMSSLNQWTACDIQKIILTLHWTT